MGIEVGKVYRTKGGHYVVADRVEPHAALSFIVCWVYYGSEGWCIRYYMDDGEPWAKDRDNTDIVAEVCGDEAAIVRAEYALWAGED